MLTKKQKILSASAVALLALSGSATGALSAKDQEEVNLEDQELLEETQLDGEDVEKEDSDNKEDNKEESDKEGTKEESEEDTKEVSKAKVDETKVVPEEDLPYYESSGILDFGEYHKIAKGRALPRPLTSEEEDFFEEFVITGVTEEVEDDDNILDGDGGHDSNYVRLYPNNYYSGDGIILKWHKFTDIQSELLTLDKQAEYLKERKEEFDTRIADGYIYDEELGDFIVNEIDESEDIDDPNDYNPGDFEDENPTENEDAKYHVYYEDKELYEDFALYDELSDQDFATEYGSNFIYKGIIEKDGFDQQEYKLGNGLTLVVEASYFDEDNISLNWGVVKEVIKYDTNDSGREGRYNLATNSEHEDYIEGNILGSGHELVREKGAYTPWRFIVEYFDENVIPHMYRMIAVVANEGDEIAKNSSVVLFNEYGIPIEELEGIEDEDESGESGGGSEDGSGSESEDGSGSESGGGSGSESEGESGDSSEDGSGSGSGETGDGSEGESGEDSEGGSGKGSGEESEDGTGSESSKSEESKKSSERFLQTGANLVWGAIVSGLGLGAVGAYLKKGKKDEDLEDKEE